MDKPVNKWLIVPVVMLPTMMEIIDSTIVNVALPHIQGSLSIGTEEVTWVLTSYLISNAIIIPMTAWLAGRFGRKRYLLFSLFLFIFSSLMCGMAPSLYFLLLARFLQGLGGGGLQPVSQAILLESFPIEERGMAISIYMMGTIVGPTIGPILGGWITDNWNWRWCFYINVPIGILSFSLAFLFVHDPSYIRRMTKNIDYVGLSLLAIGLGSLQTVLDQGQLKDWFGSRFIMVLSIVSAVALVAFVINELFAMEPLVDLKIFKKRSYVTGSIIIFVAFLAFFGSVVLLPLFVQRLMGYTAFLAGLVMGPGALASIFFLPMVGRFTRKVDARYLLAIGFAGQIWALSLMSRFNLEVGFWNVVGARVIQGASLGFFFVPLATAAFLEISKQEMGNATALYNLLRNLGSSFGTAIITTILARRTQFHHYRLVEHLTQSSPLLQRAYQGLEPVSPSHVHRLGIIYRSVVEQATVMAYDDAFFFCCLLFMLLLSTLLVLKKTT